MPIAQYSLGPAQRPELYFDPGFADCSRPATAADRALLASWRVALEGAEAIQGVPGMPKNDLPDGLAAYRHFQYGKGRRREFSYERYVSQDASGRVTLDNAVFDIQEGILGIATQHRFLTGFQITGTGIRCGANDNPPLARLFPYPETENWKKAIGAHWIWMSALVTVTRGSEWGFVATVTLHAEDLYNFNPGDNDADTEIPDAMNGRFEESCLAREYLNVSTLDRVVRWRATEAEANVTNPSAGSRERNPQDNRRMRNRL